MSDDPVTQTMAKGNLAPDRLPDRPVAPPPRSLPRHSDRRNRRWVFGLQEGLQLLWWWIAGR